MRLNLMTVLKYKIGHALCALFLFACTSTKKGVETIPSESVVQEKASWIKATGKVSDMYVANGCSFVIISIRKKEKDTLVLIPSSPIAGFEKNNLSIKFSYRTLKTHTKKGCGPGISVQIMEIKKQ